MHFLKEIICIIKAPAWEPLFFMLNTMFNINLIITTKQQYEIKAYSVKQGHFSSNNLVLQAFLKIKRNAYLIKQHVFNIILRITLSFLCTFGPGNETFIQVFSISYLFSSKWVQLHIRQLV